MVIGYQRLEQDTGQWSDRFRGAQPFPHLVIDDLIDPGTLCQAAREFPPPTQMAQRPGRVGMLEQADRRRLGPTLLAVSDDLLGARFTRWLSMVTALDGLRTDPDGSWGALRQSGGGVEGRIHAPPARHPDKPWYRALTLILHLSDGMNESNGGCFQLWGPDRSKPVVSVAPLFNRAVVFLALPTALHSPSRIRPEGGATRKVMQVLYYTEENPCGDPPSSGRVGRREPGSGH